MQHTECVDMAVVSSNALSQLVVPNKPISL